MTTYYFAFILVKNTFIPCKIPVNRTKLTHPAIIYTIPVVDCHTSYGFIE